MGHCKTHKTASNIASLIDMVELLNGARQGQTRETTLSFLDKTTAAIGKMEVDGVSKYTLLTNSKMSLKYRVSEIINPSNKKGKATLSMEAGTYLHSVYEDIANLYIAHGTAYKKNIADIRNKRPEFKLTDKQFDKIVGSFDRVLTKAQKHQDLINKKLGTNDSFVLRSEQIIIDPDYSDGGLGGTIDMLIVFSDNTAAMVDFKSSSTDKTSAKNITMHNSQMRMYKQVLIKNYGVDGVIFADVVPVKIAIDKETKKFTKFDVHTLDEKDNKNPNSAPIKGDYNITGYEKADEFVKAQYTKIAELQSKIKNERSEEKRNAYANQIQSLKEGISAFLDKAEFEHLIDYVHAILVPQVDARLKEDFYDNMEISTALGDIQDIIDEVKTYTSLSRQMSKYIEDVYEDKERRKEVSDKVDSLQGWSNRYLERLSEVRDNLALPKEIYGEYYNNSGKLLATHTSSYLEQQLGRMSSFDNHPVFKAWSSSVLQMHQEIDYELRMFSENAEKAYNKLRVWAKENGKSNKDIVDALIHNGNYHSKLSKEGISTIKDARNSEDYTKLHEIFEIKSFWKDSYEKRLEKKKNELGQIFTEGSEQYTKALENFKQNFDLENSKTAWTNTLNNKYLQRKSVFNEKYKSEEYKQIEQNTALKEWFDFVTSSNETFRDMLGINDYLTLPDNFYPNIRAELAEILLNDPSYVAKNPSVLTSSLYIQENDTSFKQHDEFGELKEVPIYWINPIDNHLKSYDILNTTMMFAKMAVTHKYGKKYEAIGNALRSTLANMAEINKNTNRQVEYGIDGDKITTESDVKLFDTFLDYYIYGITTKEQGVNIDWLGGINSTKLIQAVMSKTRSKALGLNFIAGIAGGLNANLQVYINSFKDGVYTREQITEAGKELVMDRKNSLAIVHMLDAGMESNFHASLTKNKTGIRKYVNERLLYSPYRIADETVMAKHTLAMSKNYGLNDLNQIKRLENLPEGTPSLRDMIKEVNLEDNDKPVFVYEGKTREETEKINAAFRQMTRRAWYNVAGSVAEEDIYAAKASLLANVLMMFKSWMPGMITERAGKYKVDDILDVHTVGRYTTLPAFFKSTEGTAFKKILAGTTKNVAWTLANVAWLAGRQGKKGIINNQEVTYQRLDLARTRVAYARFIHENPHLKDKVSEQDFVNTYEKQLKALMVELRIILGIAAAVIALAELGDDDDEPLYKQNWGVRQFYKLNRKLLSEMTYFFDPTSLTGLLDSGIPAIRTFTDSFHIVTNGFDELRDGTLGENSKNDQTPLFYYSSHFINGWNGISQIVEVYDKDKRVK
jgi:hypothetical protein